MTALLLLALAADPVFDAPVPPPATATQLIWRYQDKDALIYALSRERADELASQIHACQARVDQLTLQVGQKTVDAWGPSWWMWMAVGGVLGAGGAYVALRK